jgi:formylmethanofuran dehydrogenase subunit E
MYRTDDPYDDFLRHDAEQQAWLDSLPRCAICGEPIQDEYCYEINGENICEECLYENYRKAVI